MARGWSKKGFKIIETNSEQYLQTNNVKCFIGPSYENRNK